MQSYHTKLLQLAKENFSDEVGILVDLHSWEIDVIIGKGNMVKMSWNMEAYAKLAYYRKNTLLFMHNHPSSGTFSGEDFKMFCKYPSLYMMTVVGNDGTVYVLQKLFNFEPNIALSYYFERANYYKSLGKLNDATLAMRDLLKEVFNYGLYYKRGVKV